MSIITLGGIQYILESIGDESIPAHDYDSVIDISKSEDPDEWFGRVQAEWPSLPDEIKNKVIDSTGSYVGKLNADISGETPEPINEAPMDEASKDMQGNEVYDFAQGKAHAKSLDNAALEHVRQDLIDVITIQEKSNKEGFNTPKLGYYWDEYWTVMDEISRRIKAGQEFNLTPWSLDNQPVDDKVQELGE